MNGTIRVNNQSDDALRERVHEAARQLEQNPSASPSSDALASAKTEEDFQQALLRFLREQGAVDIQHIPIPRRPGPLGIVTSWCRRVMWRLLRYQHEQLAMRHNAVHALLTSALEYERMLNARQRRNPEQGMRDAEDRRPAPPGDST